MTTRPAPAEGMAGRIVTVPNLITAARIAGIPVVLALLAVPDARVVALIGLGVLAATDWVDGFLARRLGQVSELGRILDPLADHLLIHATGIALAMLEIVPWWIAVGFLVGDGIFAVLFLIRPRAMMRVRVHWTARARAVCVGVGYPLAVLGSLLAGSIARDVAIALLCVGLAFQVAAVVAYARVPVGRPPTKREAPPGSQNRKEPLSDHQVTSREVPPPGRSSR